ncbi:fungal-specific transcription factor domain-containing protein [Melanogaster broomeanus]|nr:fungal-specific transcription factor domain-containing protein [Melanogaster broomeanus]
MSTARWNESEHSDEEANQDSSSTRKRSSRACDQCRKTKSKCEPSTTPETCKSCALGGNACTFLGPSYKRGPPKGYIQAIEQRWHQVESLLGALLACPDRRVQDLLTDIRQDDLAREILNRVDTGPFGPSGRLSQPAGATKEDFFACIFRSNESSARDAARSRRQSRISREIVSSSRNNKLSTVPTSEWQDRLSARLSTAVVGGSSSASMRATPSQSPTRAFGGAPLPQRRRLDDPSSGAGPSQPDWNEMYTMEGLSDSDDTDESQGATAFGQLSLDENQEVRFHGKASGLHLLIRNDRLDGRLEGGVWKLPMARFWPSAKADMSALPPEVDTPIIFPPVAMQDRLIDLYFSYVHPIFPVIHKGCFLREYNDNPNTPEPSRGTPSSNPEPSQTVTKLLLLSMFSIAARYLDECVPESMDELWEAGCDYLAQARNVLAQVSHSCRGSTCQALLLLGHREFGIGSMEQGWLYIGMAIRMAQDLGLNRAADNWQFNGRRMFSAEENQVRKQIWWACCIADKYVCWRPTCISEGDFDTLLPDAEEASCLLFPLFDWANLSLLLHQSVSTVLTMRCFRAAASLSVIIGSIVSSVYPVKPTRRGSRRAVLSNLEARLDQWYLELPDDLRYDPASKRNSPPPPVLYIHIKYWSAVLLLHRAFIPNWKGSEPILQNPPPGSDTTSLKAFDLCQSAATYISTIVTTYHDNFNLKRSSPFLSSYILSAGIMHIVTLTLRPSNVQAYYGLQQLLAALREMQTTWPSAVRACDLLNGVKVQVDSNLAPLMQGPDRQKRGADDAFGKEKSSDFLQREAFSDSAAKERTTSTTGIQDISTRMMAHMLGLDIPGIEPSTSYLPGYEWWPRTTSAIPPPYQQPPQSITSASSSESLLSMHYPSAQGDQDWRIQGPSTSYSYDFQGPSNNHYQI